MSLLSESRIKAQWLRERGRILAHEGSGDVYKLLLHAPEIARRAVPGQFVQVRTAPADSAAVDPLLRRPFSLCEIRPEAGEISLIYRVVGRGTRALSAMPVGTELDLLGPLGHSFPDPKAGEGNLLLIGGGLGIPPMAAAAVWAVAQGRETAALLGARNVAYLAGAHEVAAAGVPVTIVTDDGSAGEKAFVTGPLERMLAQGGGAQGGSAGGGGALGDAVQVGDAPVGAEGVAERVGEVWACGPEAMLNAVKRLCKAAGVPCFVSVERHMACGFGACIGCTVPKADGSGFVKACQDGPVFDAEEVDLNG